jgi:hypothetical protein
LTALLGAIPVASAATFTLFGSVGGPRRPNYLQAIAALFALMAW